MNIRFYTQAIGNKSNFGKQNVNTINRNNSQSFNISSQYQSCDTFHKSPISFGGNKIQQASDMCGDFMNKYRQIYANRPVEDVISQNFDKLQILNSGSSKKVYLFPKMEEYLIGHLYRKPQDNMFAKMQKREIDFPKYNFGQNILSNDVISVMKRVSGTANSLDDYFSIMKHINTSGEATPQMAQEYLSKLKLFKDFPQSA